MKLSEIIKSKNYEAFDAIEKADYKPFQETEVTDVKELLKTLPKSHPVWVAFLELHSLGHADKFKECYKVVDTGSYITLKVRGTEVEDYRASAKSKNGERVYKTEIALRKYKPEPFETKIADNIYTQSKVSNSVVMGRPTDKPL